MAGDIKNLLLYPEVFGILVLDKAYSVTKSALVPALVADRGDLVAANSRLARIATVSSLASGAIAVGILNAADAVQVLRVAALLYFGATALALRIPPSRADRLPDVGVERNELRSPRVHASAAAMGVLRGAIGFLVFLVAFGLKRDAEPLWFFGAVAAASVFRWTPRHVREPGAAPPAPPGRTAARHRPHGRVRRVRGGRGPELASR